jgi:hypothetical protein
VAVAGGKKDFEQPTAAGWYPDPFSADGRGERYFDGKKWGTSMTPLAGHKPKKHKEARPGPSGSTPTRSRRALGPAIVFLLLVGILYIVPKVQHHGSNKDDVAANSPAAIAALHPPAGQEESSHPLGVPGEIPAGTGKFELRYVQTSGSAVPVAWDPCRPIHYVINPSGAPKDGAALVRSAIARVSRATGLRFVDDGATDERPDKERAPYLSDKYHKDRWAPVLIAWSDDQAYPELAGYIAGLGGGDPVYAKDGRLVYVSGQVVFDRDQLATSKMVDRRLVKTIMLHELGHLVGLGHTSDRTEVMFSESQFNVRDYGVGDLRGLALLGTQDCFPDV